MAQMYAALKMKMGTWTYYSVRMKMSEVASEIKFASEVNDDKTLDEAIQRTVNESRAKTQIVDYLVRSDERFFNSLVVAALDGNPKFNPVSLANEPEFKMVADMFTDTFGVLTFDDTIQTYALDGQHRLYAIKDIINGDSPPPVGFSDETINVIFVTASTDGSREQFLKSYRRLFSSLNRHARTTAANTDIIMDEDDRFAIVTRRLFSDFDFFKWNGHDEDPKIDTLKATENLDRNSTAWATLVGLYNMNITFLWDQETYGKYKKGHDLIQLTPTDEETDNLYGHLDKIWDGLLRTLPVLMEDPSKKRKSGSDGHDEFQDNLLFRPMGQTKILARLARRLLNHFEVLEDSSDDDFMRALKPLSYVDWNLQSHLWRDLLTVKDIDERWQMRNDNDRVAAVAIGYGILTWVLGLENLSEDQLEELKKKWSFLLSGTDGGDRDKRENETFGELIALRKRVLNECY